MRVLLDENLDWRLRRGFDPAFEVVTVSYRGWGGLQDGELLRRAATEFDVFVTLDTKLQYQQNVAALDLAIVVLHSPTALLSDVERLLPQVNALLPSLLPGGSYSVRID